MLEHDHHGPMGGGGQTAGRIAATLLEGQADEAPGVEASWLHEG
jgi:hypothetical protein